METKLIQKLVRDRIIERIMENGEAAEFSVVAREKMPQELRTKLIEEAVEMKEAAAPEFPHATLITEIADVLEVLREITKRQGILWETFYVRQYRYAQQIAKLAKQSDELLFCQLIHTAEVISYQTNAARLEDDLLKVLVIVLSIIQSRGIEWREVERARITKRSTHGGFEMGHYLVSTSR